MIMPNFVEIGQMIAEMWQFIFFFYICWIPVLTTHIVNGLYRCAKFGCDHCSNFYNMKV